MFRFNIFGINTRKLDAYRVYLFISGFSSLAFLTVFTINMIYQVETVGLDPLQLVLIGTVLEGTVLLFEIPTGVVADLYSRRLSVVIGFALLGAGMLIEGSLPFFGTLLLASFVSGIGYTFISGAQDAWIVDEIGAENAGRAFIRSSQMGSAVGLAGIALGAVLGSLAFNIPILTGGLFMLILAIFLVLFMPETGFVRPAPQERQSIRQRFGDMAATFRDGRRLVRASPLLMTLLLIGVLHGAFSEGFDRLWTAHVLEDIGLPALGIGPAIWFGFIDAVSMLLSIGVDEVIRRRVDTRNHAALARSLSLIYGLVIVGLLVFALAGNFALALGAYWLASVMRGSSRPLFGAWLNQNIESKVRATVLSIYSQADAFGQIAGGPGVGFIGQRFSIRAALSVSAVILAPVLPLFGRSLRQGPAAEIAVDEAAA